MNSIDLYLVRRHLDILREERRESEYLLDILKRLQLQDNQKGGINHKLISEHLYAVAKQKGCIQSRINLLESTIEKMVRTTQEISDSLDDAIQMLLNNAY